LDTFGALFSLAVVTMALLLWRRSFAAAKRRARGYPLLRLADLPSSGQVRARLHVRVGEALTPLRTPITEVACCAFETSVHLDFPDHDSPGTVCLFQHTDSVSFRASDDSGERVMHLGVKVVLDHAWLRTHTLTTPEERAEAEAWSSRLSGENPLLLVECILESGVDAELAGVFEQVGGDLTLTDGLILRRRAARST